VKYNELTRRLFGSASRAGVIAGGHRGSGGDRSQGTWVQFDLALAAGAIVDARFLAFGCAHTIAVAQWLAEQSIGLALPAPMPRSVAELRALFAVPVNKLGRLLIIEDAWKAAVADAIDSASRAPTS
jgi:hypothetical protein